MVRGSANTGAPELSRHVDLSIAIRAPILPQRLAGQDLFRWLTRPGTCERGSRREVLPRSR